MTVCFDIPVIETDRLILRGPQMSDIEPMLSFMTSDRSRFVRSKAEMDANTTWRALAHVAGMWHLRGYGSFVIEDKATGAAIGMTGPWHPITWPECELGWSIWPEAAEGEGYAFEAASAARDFAFGTLGWTTAVSYIDPANARSIALAERLGCRLDADAARPDDLTCLVYRHPAPEVCA
ncbi:Protein export cytoplasm protein SecA ATPase RNA helicase [Rhodovulum sp. P5]|uniref:GNAT family N-acetyltransferase n=1 Tax=Rhodovulum sp. P5 TaxID=1564506 RepID=UPI0009C20C05|nr:GNAT family N-acetyltransferase [Rhodovulum sp. P5]ARE41109.1 Protein export cytoplasm protein SecA ATPase RNA helicase [Rhodovulum sp. P5]